MAGILTAKIEFGALGEQFRGLRGRHPIQWPVLPRALLLVGIFAGVIALAWLAYFRLQIEDLEAGQAQEVQLRAQYVDKLRLAVNLEALRKQRDEVALFVNQLEKQLPSKAEMDALLSDINQAGVGRGLQFELFKPGQLLALKYYAELPISIRLSGGYHDLAAFSSDVSNLARIVTLKDIHMQLQEKTGQLSMDVVAKTYRYLDAEEIVEQRKEAAKAARGKPRPGATR
jgi:type IV pilus assembly protein PilO